MTNTKTGVKRKLAEILDRFGLGWRLAPGQCFCGCRKCNLAIHCGVGSCEM